MEIKFKYEEYTRVNTPLVDMGIITMLGYQDGIVKYYVENNVDGATNCWWPEDKISPIETKPDV